jgi:hypothetical protein
MKRFVLVYSGPPAPPDATHEGWPEWFGRIGDALLAFSGEYTIELFELPRK